MRMDEDSQEQCFIGQVHRFVLAVYICSILSNRVLERMWPKERVGANSLQFLLIFSACFFRESQACGNQSFWPRVKYETFKISCLSLAGTASAPHALQQPGAAGRYCA